VTNFLPETLLLSPQTSTNHYCQLQGHNTLQKNRIVVLRSINLQYALHPPTQFGRYKLVKAPRLLFQVLHVVHPDISRSVNLLAQALGQTIDGCGQDFNVNIGEWRELSELIDLYIFSSIELRGWSRIVRMARGQRKERRLPRLHLHSSLANSYRPLSAL